MQITPSARKLQFKLRHYPKLRSSGDNWCVHYAGFYQPGIGNGPKTHCNAGVEYASVANKVDFTTKLAHERTAYLQHEAHPCFKHEAPLTDGCAKCRYPTPEEIEAKHSEMTEFVNRMGVARAAIIAELERRHKDGDDVSGAGSIICPVCKTGKLNYSRAGYNGHIHARCTTEGCAAWME